MSIHNYTPKKDAGPSRSARSKSLGVPRIGRPSGFRPEAIQLAKTGITQPDLAAELGVTNRTLSRWALKYPEFRAALDRGLVRRAAERRWAETAPLRAAAAELRRMIAEARTNAGACEGPAEDGGRTVATSDGGLISTPSIAPQDDIRRTRRERISAWHEPTEDEEDPSHGEPVELLDPRSDW